MTDPKPMSVEEAVRIDNLQERLRRDREALRKLRGSMAINLAHFLKTWKTDLNVVAATDGELAGWLAALDAILEEKP